MRYDVRSQRSVTSPNPMHKTSHWRCALMPEIIRRRIVTEINLFRHARCPAVDVIERIRSVKVIARTFRRFETVWDQKSQCSTLNSARKSAENFSFLFSVPASVHLPGQANEFRTNPLFIVVAAPSPYPTQNGLAVATTAFVCC
jgi:hypothetical protein